ncbi:MAG: efflux RND transporter periplasmic adaptor subunit [Rickettsiaceae bacterium]|nr:efflux RND transporter periplasmic adaptor subunit [Rickettsiaceae bacterium]
MSKFGNIVIFFIVCAINISFCVSANTVDIVEVRAKHPKLMEFYKVLYTIGHCSATTSKDYFAESDGIVSYAADSKHMFKKGELILAIDKDLSESQKKLAESDFRFAELNFDRDQKLFEKNVIAEEKFEQTKIRYYDSKAKLASTLKAIEGKMIYAPFDGIISAIKLKKGDNVKKDDFLVNIVNGDKKLIKFNVAEGYNLQNTNLHGIISVGSDTYNLENIRISSNLSADGSSYNAIAEINAPNQLIHNSIVNITIKYDIHNNLGIDQSAIFMINGKNMVYLVDYASSAKAVEINVGATLGDQVEISSPNILDSTLIVTEGIQKISDGVRLNIAEDATYTKH